MSSPTGVVEHVLGMPGLVALWDFAEPAGEARVSRAAGRHALVEGAGPVPRVSGGPLSGHAAEFRGDCYLKIPNGDLGALNIAGPGAAVTVVAWVKRADRTTGFLGGIWNEGDRKRQYGLFLHLPTYGGADQVVGHVSATGGPTPGYPYSRDYSANITPLATGRWYTAAFTYDGNHVRSFLDGRFEPRPTFTDNQGQTYAKNPYAYPDSLSDAGGDFTVGAVRLGPTPGAMGNHFHGQLGGLAVFDRALSGEELFQLHAGGASHAIAAG